MPVLSIDTGDLDIVEQFAATGYITDATTNPLFVSQAGLSGDPRYVAFVEEAITYAKEKMCNMDGCDVDDAIALAMDRLAVNLGKNILALGIKGVSCREKSKSFRPISAREGHVHAGAPAMNLTVLIDEIPGYVSTEVDPRLSFDTEESLVRARRIIQMYEDEGIARSRVLIKLAATWEGIAAAEILEKEGITCNLTLVFGTLQAKACAQRGVRLISPFPGRILDWHKADKGFDTCPPAEDPGVIACADMYGYFKASSTENSFERGVTATVTVRADARLAGAGTRD
jgi:transaldolase